MNLQQYSMQSHGGGGIAFDDGGRGGRFPQPQPAGMRRPQGPNGYQFPQLPQGPRQTQPYPQQLSGYQFPQGQQQPRQMPQPIIGGAWRNQQQQVPQQYNFLGGNRGGGGSYYRGPNGLQPMPDDYGYQFPMYGQQQQQLVARGNARISPFSY